MHDIYTYMHRHLPAVPHAGMPRIISVWTNGQNTPAYSRNWDGLETLVFQQGRRKERWYIDHALLVGHPCDSPVPSLFFLFFHTGEIGVFLDFVCLSMKAVAAVLTSLEERFILASDFFLLL